MAEDTVARESARRIRVLHIIASQGMGGTERMLYYSIPRYDEDRFESRVVCFSAVSSCHREWRDVGIGLDVLGMRRSVSPIAMYKLWRLSRRFRPDVVCMYGSRVNYMARPVVRMLGVPVVIACQRGIEDWKGRFDVWLNRLTSRWVTAFVGNAAACCRQLRIREGIAEEKLRVIPNGIDVEIPADVGLRVAAIRRTWHLAEGTAVIVCVARMQEVKGQHELVRAVAELARRTRAFRVLFVGRDCRDGFVQRLAVELGVADLVSFVGYSENVVDYLAAADIFVLPSLSEGMPVSVLEAMHLGRAVVATDVGGTSEVIADGETGLLVPPADPGAMADALLRMIEDDESRARFGEAGLRRAQKEFTMDVMIERYQDLFAQLLGVRRTRLRAQVD